MVKNRQTAACRKNRKKGKGGAWETFGERYRPMMKELLEQEVPGTDAEGIIQQALADLSGILVHYRYREGEEKAVGRYLRHLLRGRAGAAASPAPHR